MILPQCEGRCRVRLGQIGDSGENPTLSIVAVALRGWLCGRTAPQRRDLSAWPPPAPRSGVKTVWRRL